VKFVGAALAYDVDDAAAGAAVLGVVVAQNELKLLYALLREGRANGVDGVVDGIRTVNTDRVPRARAPPMLKPLLGAGPMSGPYHGWSANS